MVEGKDGGKSGKRKQNFTMETGRGAMLKGGKRREDKHGSTRPLWLIFFTTPTRCAEVGRGWKKKLWKDINHLSNTYGTGMADETNAEKRKAESSGRAQSGEAGRRRGAAKDFNHGWTLMDTDEKQQKAKTEIENWKLRIENFFEYGWVE
jgi:hypothetical protein